jgi:hypothetical protein
MGGLVKTIPLPSPNVTLWKHFDNLLQVPRSEWQWGVTVPSPIVPGSVQLCTCTVPVSVTCAYRSYAPPRPAASPTAAGGAMGGCEPGGLLGAGCSGAERLRQLRLASRSKDHHAAAVPPNTSAAHATHSAMVTLMIA